MDCTQLTKLNLGFRHHLFSISLNSIAFHEFEFKHTQLSPEQ